MSAAKHTPEPWFAVHIKGSTRRYITSHDAGSGDIADLYHYTRLGSRDDLETFTKENAEANAARIVACVNACAGMDDPEANVATLKADSGYMVKYRDAYLHAITERYELLEALRDAVRALATIKRVDAADPKGTVAAMDAALRGAVAILERHQ
jgi:hypothetical protein